MNRQCYKMSHNKKSTRGSSASLRERIRELDEQNYADKLKKDDEEIERAESISPPLGVNPSQEQSDDANPFHSLFNTPSGSDKKDPNQSLIPDEKEESLSASENLDSDDEDDDLRQYQDVLSDISGASKKEAIEALKTLKPPIRVQKVSVDFSDPEKVNHQLPNLLNWIYQVSGKRFIFQDFKHGRGVVIYKDTITVEEESATLEVPKKVVKTAPQSTSAPDEVVSLRYESVLDDWAAKGVYLDLTHGIIVPKKSNKKLNRLFSIKNIGATDQEVKDLLNRNPDAKSIDVVKHFLNKSGKLRLLSSIYDFSNYRVNN